MIARPKLTPIRPPGAHRSDASIDPMTNHCRSDKMESDYKENRCIGVES